MSCILLHNFTCRKILQAVPCSVQSSKSKSRSQIPERFHLLLAQLLPAECGRIMTHQPIPICRSFSVSVPYRAAPFLSAIGHQGWQQGCHSQVLAPEIED